MSFQKRKGEMGAGLVEFGLIVFLVVVIAAPTILVLGESVNFEFCKDGVLMDNEWNDVISQPDFDIRHDVRMNDGICEIKLPIVGWWPADETL